MASDVDVAVAAARSGPAGLGHRAPAERSAALTSLAPLRRARRRLVAEEVSQTGKPIRLAAEFDVPGSIDNIDFFAGRAPSGRQGRRRVLRDHTSSFRREAIGVVGSISPWNYPLQMAGWKVLPAFAAGCTVVLKPSEMTPLTTLPWLGWRAEAGLPPACSTW